MYTMAGAAVITAPIYPPSALCRNDTNRRCSL